jgi:phage baseplate assembly protein W|tara:strand:+ start:111 stop:548 length:438 start_codon:yes stop_codon:yes gene_type:complete
MARAFSIEDRTLDTSIISSRNVAYKDVDLSFTAKPAGDIYKKTDAAAVKQAVKNLLLTSRGEKPFDANYGSNLGSALFSLDTDFDPEYVQNIINDTIVNYEPRARVLAVSVKLKPDQNSIDATIEFQVVNTREIVTVDVSLARLR